MVLYLETYECQVKSKENEIKKKIKQKHSWLVISFFNNLFPVQDALSFFFFFFLHFIRNAVIKMCPQWAIGESGSLCCRQVYFGPCGARRCYKLEWFLILLQKPIRGMSYQQIIVTAVPPDQYKSIKNN